MEKKIMKKCMKYKYLISMIIGLILLILIPPFLNMMINSKPLFFPEFFGFISDKNSSEWIGFYGSIIGGFITLIGVAWTVIDQNRKREEDMKDAFKPVLVANGCSYEKIKTSDRGKVYECILEYKNVGKGILYNPKVFNIEYAIDNKIIGKLSPSLSVKNYIEIESATGNDIMIELELKELKEIYRSLKGRGNTISLQITMFVGGKDMFGRDIATKLDFKSQIVFFSESDIELPLMPGELTSVVIFNDDEIAEVINNADYRYNVHR